MSNIPWGLSILLSLVVVSASADVLDVEPSPEIATQASMDALLNRSDSAGFNPFGAAPQIHEVARKGLTEDEPDLMLTSVFAAIGLTSLGVMFRALWAS